ncbi:L-type lectin-domain containing receptor kinase IX.1, partial [Mucuna pruriens]
MAGCEWHFGVLLRRIILFILIIIPIAYAQPQYFDYPNFNSPYVKQLKLEGYASISGSAIQLTKNRMNPNKESGTVGRVIYPEPINLWDNSSNELKHFSTNFSFVVSSNQSHYGDGLAFFLASTNLPSTNDKHLRGGGLGVGFVAGHRNHNHTDYQFVAVEFDTYSNKWDPDGAHVGINVNNMKSKILEKWWTNITQRRVSNCRINYNCRSNTLKVSFTAYKFSDGNVTQTTQHLEYHVNITNQLPKSVIIGISAATGRYAEEHTLLSWSFSTSSPRKVHLKKESKLINTKLLMGIVIGTGLFVSLLGLVHILLWRLTKGKEERTSEATSHLMMDDEFQMSTGPKKINYYELATATNNFEETQKLGQGGFGGVYKGYFKDSNTYAAIKRISADSRQGVKQYAAEVTIISQLSHRNLVKLTGWCHKKNDLLLIYEYMENGSLDSHLFRGESILSWQVRYNIALGLASALLYLQEEWDKCVLHRDIKSSNIMLDSNFNPKLGDFGLASLVDHEQGSQTTDVAGTMGYIAPEYMITGMARKESDIFSFGVVLLEVATGRKAIHHKDMKGEVSLVEWVWELYGLRNLLAAADANLCGKFDVQQMECLLVVGLWCANPDSASRPSVRQVINVLNFEASLPILPLQIPVTILFFLIIPIANVEPQFFYYPNFNSTYVNQLKLDGNASTSGSAIQLTVNATDPSIHGLGTAGRVTYSEQINLRDKNSNELKDFITNFSFVVSSNQSNYGDGLAFFLASPELPSTNDNEQLRGGALGIGLADGDQNLLHKDYQFVAVEFDTFSNNWDPDGAHVGVNINDMKSEILEAWWTNITQGEVCNCSIEYNSRSNTLKVSYTGYKFSGGNLTKTTQQLSCHVNITEILPESVIVGISAATGGYAEEHTLLSWSFSTSPPSKVDPKNERVLINKELFEGIGIGIGLVHILLGRLNKGKDEDRTLEATSDLNMDDEFQMSSGPKKINYYDLETATNNFEETQKLGQGGFGGVYKGYFKDSNTYAAIKRISADSRQGVKQYAAEVTIISQLRHRNLIKLTGWCHKKNDLLLIYEYMENGSLDSHLFRGESILSWQVRYNIALGLASALLYLQEEWEKCVLHRDIKSSNIMLDANFNPKLGDFGLARLVDHEKGSQTTDVAGTMGYIAPEYMTTGKARKESDIFSFGVVLLEVATGRKAIHHKDMEGEVSLVEWVWELYGLRNLLAAADPNLCGKFNAKQMECLLVVGLWCASPDSASRPSIRQVINVLNFEAALPILPQQIPVQVYVCPITNELFLTVSSSLKATS